MRKGLSILAFHRVLQNRNVILHDEMYAERFDRLLGVLKKYFLILPLSEAIREFRKKNGATKIVSITFDDGYKDNHSVALPILLKHKLKATFFVASGFLNGQWMWNDGISEAILNVKKDKLDLSNFSLGSYDLSTIEKRWYTLNLILDKVKYRPTDIRIELANDLLSKFNIPPPEHLMMNSQDVKSLYSSGMEIGGHTINHPILSKLSYQDAYDEIEGNKRDLEFIINAKIRAFAYPNGKPGIDYTEETIDLLKEAGYQYSVSTVSEIVRPGSDLFQLPRYTPWDKNSIKFALRLWLKMVSVRRFNA